MAQYNIRFPRFGTVTLLSMWQKGKKGKNYRYLIEEADGSKRFIWVDDFMGGNMPAGHPFHGKKGMEYVEYDGCIIKSPTHIKNSNYNYYHVKDDCENEFEAMMAEFEASNPLVAEKESGGPGMHCDYSRVTYKLWEKI